MTAKPFWESKVLWFNFLSLALLLIDTAIATNIPLVASQWFPFMVVTVNFALRLVTSESVNTHG
jgi:hypothetical protein